MIELNQVNYYYRQECVQFDLSIAQAERVAIIGPSGAGKSTLLNLIAGFILPESGKITLNDIDATRLPPNKRPVAMLFQDNNLFTHLTVYQNMGLGISPSLRLTSLEKDYLADIANKVGLSEYLQRYPDQLSGGQRQRVALARCLLQKRPILLLDEPFSSLDPLLRLDMLSLVEEICHTYSLTLLMVTHHLDETKQITPRTLAIQHGKIIADSQTDLLITDLSNLYKSNPHRSLI
ncbi:MAG: thiamine ABC transporter ATP-binding protein ThiQ [Candidatus Schmidhempelia sp.]|nr:thiamine ABC transporter ATP-binding protein ThiQ [Candidatus Schmidhempelia sp.]